MEENKQHFIMLCFIISRKAKMQLKHTHKRIYEVCGEGAVADRSFKSGWRSSMLEISPWMMLRGRVHQ